MSWARTDVEYSTIQKICLNMAKYGSIPKHVAFIMDGNRRFANEKLLRRCDGHLKGFSKLSEVLRWCSDFGIEEVSVFAFSIENFKRATEEVSFLMNLAEEKLRELNEKRQVLNICMAYTGRDEITQAVETARIGVQDGIIIPSDITPQLLSKCMYMRLSTPLDLIIRTSGEVRLSDFLVWQAAESGAVCQFETNYWPDFSFWDFFSAIVNYQLSRYRASWSNSTKVYCSTDDQMDEARRNRTDQFLQLVDKNFWERLSNLV